MNVMNIMNVMNAINEIKLSLQSYLFGNRASSGRSSLLGAIDSMFNPDCISTQPCPFFHQIPDVSQSLAITKLAVVHSIGKFS